MIAAGEVVNRPASVVKELLENAIDAGADDISLVVKDAGRTLIQVIDNGCGMSREDAELCFERHATSKLATAEDLNHILTFGFRGEALASIAAVAEVTLKSRRQEDQTGVAVDFAASQHLSTTETSAPKGTNIAVRNLFYNVPARRKFLKSDNVELKHIIEEFERVALSKPEIALSLTHNDKDIMVLKKAKSLKFRIQDVLGSNVAGRMVDIATQTSVVKVSGYVCRPDQSRRTPGNQYFFVNGRYFRSAYLHKAVMKAYEDMIAEGAIPSYVIFLEAEPSTVDVNIHPAKTEIKFQEDSVVFQVLYACVKEALGKNSFGLEMNFEETESLPVFSKQYERLRNDVFAPQVSVDHDYNPFEQYSAKDDLPLVNTPVHHDNMYGAGLQEKKQDYSKLFDEDSIRPTARAMVISGKYIVSQATDGLCITNVRRARERILYERFLKALAAGGHASQTALFPVQVRIGADNMPTIREHAELLKSCGFDIEPLGNDTVVVNGVPDGYSCDAGKVEAMISDILLILADGVSSLPGVMESTMAERFAKLGAAEGDLLRSDYEAGKLLEALFSCQNAEFTPSGRRIIARLEGEGLEKLF
ncbi:MAG: DNA mismatch repair endonuclease MutL [Bacteroidales bacterium]|nr:DNA mismatch repair endonuclease MutL [Bacteroidales bacterium]